MRFLKFRFAAKGTSDDDLLARKIAERILICQRMAAVWLNTKTRRMPATILRILLVVICLLFAASCLMLLIRGIK